MSAPVVAVLAAVVAVVVWALLGRMVCEVAGYGRPRGLRGWLRPAARRDAAAAAARAAYRAARPTLYLPCTGTCRTGIYGVPHADNGDGTAACHRCGAGRSSYRAGGTGR